ncbi:MAG TPA: RlpA-like double-psi beta-barrel domain-containing protein [Acetobacteraceae bacterium]
MIRLLATLCALLPAACTHQPAVVPHPHYVLGAPYQVGGVWQYPRENYNAVETGVAAIYQAPHPALTDDGEVFDQHALAAAHPTLQLPAIARLTNLENGRQVLVRINDRGPDTPHRLLLVTTRTAQLLEFPSSGVARVRLEVMPSPTHAAVDSLPGAPSLPIAAAPRAPVQETPLGPAGSPTASITTWKASAAPTPAGPAGPVPVLRLPETVTQTVPDPGSLWVQLATFQSHRYAAVERARLAGLDPEIVAAPVDGQQEFRVRLGPFATISQADAALDRAIAAGVPDPRITVETGADAQEFAR